MLGKIARTNTVFHWVLMIIGWLLNWVFATLLLQSDKDAHRQDDVQMSRFLGLFFSLLGTHFAYMAFALPFKRGQLSELPGLVKVVHFLLNLMGVVLVAALFWVAKKEQEKTDDPWDSVITGVLALLDLHFLSMLFKFR